LVLLISSFLTSLFVSLLVCPFFGCLDKVTIIMAKSSNYCWFMTKLVYIASHRVLNIDPLQGLDIGDIMVLSLAYILLLKFIEHAYDYQHCWTWHWGYHGTITSIHFIIEVHWTCLWLSTLFNMLLSFVNISPRLGSHFFLFFDMLLELKS
jgi:hypothetical protein